MNPSLREDADGPGCPRHEGDPHNLCEACWALEPDAPKDAKPSLLSLRALAWAAVDAWMLRADDLDAAMDDLRDFLKGKPEAIARAEEIVSSGWEG